MKRILAILLIVVSFPASASTMFGPADCGKWMEAKSNIRKSWILGYMSGLNAMFDILVSGSPDHLNKITSADEIFVWMDNYCARNPAGKLSNGGKELLLDLATKH